MSSLASTAALRRPVVARKFALAALWTVASFAVVYLIAANVILRTRILRDIVSEGPDVELDYASAYSVWPGRVQLRGLSLAVQDYNIQMGVLAESGVVQVSLHDLLFQRFHATSVRLEGLSFRLRSRVDPSQAGSARVAAFPGIQSFADPPVHVGEKPAPTPDADYDLWQVVLDDVRAELRELWVLDYRYLGAGKIVRGGFELQPARSFAVFPAQVTLDQGAVSVADALVVQHLGLGVEGHVEYTDVQQVQGAALASMMSGRLTLDAPDVNLGVLDAHSEPSGRARVEGRADLRASVSVSAGHLEPDGTLELSASEVSVGTPIGKLSGSLSSSLKSLPDGVVEWVTTSPRVSLTSASHEPGPALGSPRLALVLQSETVGSAPSLREVRLEAPQLVVPALGWARRLVQGAGVPIEVSGRLEGRAQLSWQATHGPAARVHLRLLDAQLSTEKTRGSVGGEIDGKLDPAAHGTNSSGRFDIVLEGTEVERLHETTKPFRAAVHLPDLRVSLEPEPAFSAGVDVSANPADSLLSLALGSSMLKDLAADVFDLKGLMAEARVNVSQRSVRLELARAESGGLKGAGYWQRPASGDATGAFLISSKVANVGISLVGSDTETSWFVADDWLTAGRGSKAAPARPGAPGHGKRGGKGKPSTPGGR